MVKRGNGMTRNLHFDAVELLATRESWGGQTRRGSDPSKVHVAGRKLVSGLIPTLSVVLVWEGLKVNHELQSSYVCLVSNTARPK